MSRHVIGYSRKGMVYLDLYLEGRYQLFTSDNCYRIILNERKYIYISFYDIECVMHMCLKLARVIRYWNLIFLISRPFPQGLREIAVSNRGSPVQPDHNEEHCFSLNYSPCAQSNPRIVITMPILDSFHVRYGDKWCLFVSSNYDLCL